MIVYSVWSAFCAFRAHEPDTNITFEFLPEKIIKPDTKFLDSIQGAIEKIWKDTTSAPSEKSQGRAKRKGKAEERSFKQEGMAEGNQYTKELKSAYRLVTSRGLKRTFHCELQLLEIPRDERYHLPLATEPGKERKESIYQYLACSKRSYFLCWSILRKLQYSTRNTHGKLRVNCAFPFTPSSICQMQVLDVVKEIHIRLRENL